MAKTVDRLAHELRTALQTNGHLPKFRRPTTEQQLMLLQTEHNFAKAIEAAKQALCENAAPGEAAGRAAQESEGEAPIPASGSEAAELVAAARAKAGETIF